MFNLIETHFDGENFHLTATFEEGEEAPVPVTVSLNEKDILKMFNTLLMSELQDSKSFLEGSGSLSFTMTA